MCLYPKLIRNRKYTANKKNGGNVPYLWDDRIGLTPIGCGQCLECRKKKARDWQVRLSEEIRDNRDGVFVTFTMSNETIRKETYKIKKQCKESGLSMPNGYHLDYAIASNRMARWISQWRNLNSGKRPKYWIITELGHEGTENLHFHGVVFGDRTMIKKSWGKDFIYLGYSMDERCINYITKYVTKIDTDHKNFKARIYCSNGIGANYINRLDAKKNFYKPEGGTNEAYRYKNGSKGALPIYYRNKIYSEDEREMLWIEKLDKQERYVLGTKIDVSNGNGPYFRALREAQRKNIRLGYTDGSKDWEEVFYENQLRNINYAKRIAN